LFLTRRAGQELSTYPIYIEKGNKCCESDKFKRTVEYLFWTPHDCKSGI